MLFAEVRAFKDAGRFAKLNSLTNSQSFQFADMDLFTMVILIEGRYRSQIGRVLTDDELRTIIDQLWSY